MLSLLYVLIAGVALPVGGVQMQYLWRNQLGDVYSLGLGSAACLGAAAATMSGWCSLTVGSFICTLICTIICFFVTLKVSTQNLITFGILFGTFIGSLGTIVVTNAPNPDLLKQYYLWGAANFELVGVTTWDVLFSLSLFIVGLTVALLTSKSLTYLTDCFGGNIFISLKIYFISCSRFENNGELKNSCMLISNPSHIFRKNKPY